MGRASLAPQTGIPEPGLILYGQVRNTTASNARPTPGTLTWTITPASGSPGTVTSALTDIRGQHSSARRMPFESVVGSSTLSANTLELSSTATSCVRTNVFLTVSSTNYPATLSSPALGGFLFGPADRGRLDEVDLAAAAPGATGSTGGGPSFASTPRFVNGQFQMTVSRTIGQSYTFLTSPDLVSWTPAFVFLCTNPLVAINDPAATNFSRRFYRISQ